VSGERIWLPGETAIQRFVRTDGSIGQEHPLRVLSDDGEHLVGWLPMGAELVTTSLPDGRDPRDVPLDEMFRLPRTRGPGRWTGTSNLRLVHEREWSSVWWFFGPDLEFLSWYVNLELPRGRTDTTLDRVDGALDVVVAPDRSWRWKDEDEAEAAVAAGRITRADLAGLRAEGERAIALAEAGEFPFDGTWTDFRPDPEWPAPGVAFED
jgi:Protein of unknown function (DUF402)